MAVGAVMSRVTVKLCGVPVPSRSERVTCFDPLSVSLAVQLYVCDVLVPAPGSSPKTSGKSTVKGPLSVVSLTSTVTLPECAE
jgi:hypothetical protein